MNKKKIRLLVKNIELLLESLKLELEDEEETESGNIIKISDILQQPIVDEGIGYHEESDDGPEILLNNKEERLFYERFKLGE
jgi:hypothetical protein